jgi:hypothetical protein
VKSVGVNKFCDRTFVHFAGELLDICQQITPATDLHSMIATVRAAANGESMQNIPASIQAAAATLKVVHVPELQIFNVCDGQRQTHSVTLHPLEKCTCPASTTCCHIIAARRSIGLETSQRKPLLLSKLRKNSR